MKTDLVSKSFGLNLKAMTSIGMYGTGRSNGLLYKCYAYTLYVLATWIFPLLIASTIFFEETVDVVRLSEIMFFLPQMWILSVKILPFLKKNGEITELLERIHDEKFASRKTEHEKIAKRCIDECRKLFFFFSCFSMMTWILWAGKPLYAKDKLLPVKILLPFELTKEHPAYYLIFIYVALCGLYGGTSNTCLDCVIAGLLYHVSGQIKILKHKLVHVGEKVDLGASYVDDSEEVEQLRNDIICRQLQECIDHYDSIIRYVNDLEKIFTFVPFVQLAASCVVICISCFQVMILDPTSTSFLAMVVFVITMICQIYMYCHYGNQLYHESASIGNAAYMSDWYSFDLKSKKLLIILMERAKKPLVFKAGNLLPLSVDTFVTIIRKAYSLLAVLKKQMG